MLGNTIRDTRRSHGTPVYVTSAHSSQYRIATVKLSRSDFARLGANYELMHVLHTHSSFHGALGVLERRGREHARFAFRAFQDRIETTNKKRRRNAVRWPECRRVHRKDAFPRIAAIWTSWSCKHTRNWYRSAASSRNASSQREIWRDQPWRLPG